MLRKMPSILFLLGFLSAIGVMGLMLFLEYQRHLIPCSLCIFQRLAVILAGFIFLMGLLHRSLRASAALITVYGILGILVALLGLSISLRQIYLQSLPPSAVPACGPGLNFIFQAYPFLDALKVIFEGSGECAKVDWRTLGLSLADWAGVYFVGLMILNVLAIGFERVEKMADKKR